MKDLDTTGRGTRLRSRGWLIALASLLLAGVNSAALTASIALDVGHNRAQPGVISARGISEFEYNRALARDIARSLEGAGHRVLLIGADGLAENLARRAPQANGMDLLVSLHHDSVRPRFIEVWEYEGTTYNYSDRFSGFSLFVSRAHPQPERSLRCASAIGAALRHAGFVPSRYHADPIVGEGRTFADEENGVHFFDNLAVLKTARVPALLLEAGVIVNRDEEMRMRDPGVRARIAAGVTDAVASCVPADSPASRR